MRAGPGPGVGSASGGGRRFVRIRSIMSKSAGWGVGGNHLVPPAFEGVEQGQLGAGVGSFAADDESGAFGETVGGESAGDLADFGVFTKVAVDVDGGDPVGDLPDGFPDRFGDRQADGEADIDVLVA